LSSYVVLQDRIENFYLVRANNLCEPELQVSETTSLPRQLLCHTEKVSHAPTLSVDGSPVKNFTSQFKRSVTQDPALELKDYFKLPLEDFNTCDPLCWWSARRAQFPHLSRLTRDILSIPGSAVAVEQVFSGGRDTIALRRSRLQPETIRTLMILKQ
jgi:hypothetical protein